MNLQFEFTEQDFVEFSEHHHAHSPGEGRLTWAVHAVIAAAGLTLWLVFLVCVGPTGANVRKYAVFLLAVPLAWGIYRLAYKVNLRRVIRGMLNESHNREILGTRHLELTSQEITITGGNSPRSIPWNGVLRVEGASRAIYIYYGPAEAILIPRRAFATDEAWTVCAKTARSYFEAAQRT